MNITKKVHDIWEEVYIESLFNNVGPPKKKNSLYNNRRFRIKVHEKMVIADHYINNIQQIIIDTVKEYV